MDQFDKLLAQGEDWLREQYSSLRGRIDLGDHGYIAFGEPAIPVDWVVIGLVLLVLVLAHRGS